MLKATDGVIVCLMAVHLWFAPYSKVEESFNTQATHDLLFYRTELSRYDHHEFPGVVPRTFLGPIAVALPWLGVARWLGKFRAMVAIRGTLGLISLLALVNVRVILSTKHGKVAGNAFALLTCIQPHLLFYCSRLLPNSFALAICNWALLLFLQGKDRLAFCLLAGTTATFRAELAILTGTLFLAALSANSIGHFVAGSVVGCLCATLSSVVDSYFWSKPWPYWPELEVFIFNTLENRSSEWGISPPWWYFTNALPRAMLAWPLLLVVYCAFSTPCRTQFWRLGIPCFCFIAIYSCLPHKELRFIIYCIPFLNVCASIGFADLWHRTSRTIVRKKDDTVVVTSTQPKQRLGLIFVLAAAVFLSASAHILFIAAASRNYAGGHALARLHTLRGEATQNITVHIDTTAAMTGVSRYGETGGSSWAYSKEEGLEDSDLRSRFTHLVHARKYVDGYVVIHVEHAYRSLQMHLPLPKIQTQPGIYVHERLDVN